ncbi:hypothetical protein LshimejAT787_0107400 [Lyophyllum shimeji]|uniref:Uncharacterized protein n=1 Tax=Lyophyllum shimeji TaxID=47721 RepID=A0A9P3PE84_LYOSH|nr:hypothetical protein LshimejAT787_0107400 [Lyophyllum shimeji]
MKIELRRVSFSAYASFFSEPDNSLLPRPGTTLSLLSNPSPKLVEYSAADASLDYDSGKSFDAVRRAVRISDIVSYRNILNETELDLTTEA